MNPFKAALALFTLVLLASCAGMGIPTPESFNERLAAGYVTVTGIRTSALDLLKAKRITPDDAANIQAQADTARSGLDIARKIRTTDPAGADARLTATITALQALQVYLRSREGVK